MQHAGRAVGSEFLRCANRLIRFIDKNDLLTHRASSPGSRRGPSARLTCILVLLCIIGCRVLRGACRVGQGARRRRCLTSLTTSNTVQGGKRPENPTKNCEMGHLVADDGWSEPFAFHGPGLGSFESTNLLVKYTKTACCDLMPSLVGGCGSHHPQPSARIT